MAPNIGAPLSTYMERSEHCSEQEEQPSTQSLDTRILQQGAYLT